jgi:hypothetical protein
MFGHRIGTGIGLLDLLFDAGLVFRGARGLMTGQPSESVPAAAATTSTDSDLPKGLFTEALTQIDESYWRYIMSLLSVEVHATVTKIVRALRALDTKNVDGRNDRVSAFRIGYLLMPNKAYTKTVTGPAPQPAGQQPNQKGGGAKVTTTTAVDNRFTEADSRVVSLTRLHEAFEDLMGGGMDEKKAIKQIIADLEAEGFLSKESVLKKFFEKGKVEAAKLATETFLMLVHFRLTWDEKTAGGAIIKIDRYEEIIRRNGIAEGEEMDNIDLFLDAIAYHVNTLRATLEDERHTFFPEWSLKPIMFGLGILAFLAIVSNFV